MRTKRWRNITVFTAEVSCCLYKYVLINLSLHPFFHHQTVPLFLLTNLLSSFLPSVGQFIHQSNHYPSHSYVYSHTKTNRPQKPAHTNPMSTQNIPLTNTYTQPEPKTHSPTTHNPPTTAPTYTTNDEWQI